MTNPIRLVSAVYAAVAAVAPVALVSVPDIADRRTWRVQFDPAATPGNRALAQQVIDAFDIASVDAAEASDTARHAGMDADPSESDLMSRLKTATPAQVDAWLLANVTNLAQARTVLGAIVKYLARNA